MEPLTKEQAEALADRIEARAVVMRQRYASFMRLGKTKKATRWDVAAITCKHISREIRDGTFIEVKHD